MPAKKHNRKYHLTARTTLVYTTLAGLNSEGVHAAAIAEALQMPAGGRWKFSLQSVSMRLVWLRRAGLVRRVVYGTGHRWQMVDATLFKEPRCD